ncbi:hypothetical protein NP493_2603g00002 [Ridgeia piscesae]|uniref:Uncharacterized protein n=1 Tax=Ridgeia piscesae TaxID=27915 RepID=A0AAD9JF34_RIDPI|nr:hypothetical protein NP493_2603g00002 [Ridgeia piscesae]
MPSRSQTEPNLSATTSRINSRTRWRHHDRRSIRIETRHRQNPLLFSTFGFATANPECRVTSQSQTEPNLSAATSRIHTSAGAATIAVQLASKRDIAKALQVQPGEFGATRVLLSNTRASDVTAATAGISNSASYVLSVSCLFLCGPLRRISVNARFMFSVV